MKFLTCVFVLLVLTVAVSAHVNSTLQQNVTSTLEQHVTSPDDSSEEEEDEAPRPQRKDPVEATCRENGGEEAVKKLEKSVEKIEICIKDLVEILQIKAEAEFLLLNGSFNALIDIYMQQCSHFREMLECSKDELLSTSEVCLKEQHSRLVKIGLDVILRILDYSCSDSFKWLLSRKGYICLFPETQATVNNCTTPTVLAIGSQNLTNIVFDDEQCNDIDVSTKCVLRYMQGCEDNVPATHIMGIFNIIRTTIPCKMQPLSAQEFQLGNAI